MLLHVQNELEVSVECLSSLIGHRYLRGSGQRIALTAKATANRRQRFLHCVHRGLIPPETPPQLRKSRHRHRHMPYIVGLDRDDVSCFAGCFHCEVTMMRRARAGRLDEREHDTISAAGRRRAQRRRALGARQ